MTQNPQNKEDRELELASGGVSFGVVGKVAGKAVPVLDAFGVYSSVKEGITLQDNTEGNKADVKAFDDNTKDLKVELDELQEYIKNNKQ